MLRYRIFITNWQGDKQTVRMQGFKHAEWQFDYLPKYKQHALLWDRKKSGDERYIIPANRFNEAAEEIFNSKQAGYPYKLVPFAEQVEEPETFGPEIGPGAALADGEPEGLNNALSNLEKPSDSKPIADLRKEAKAVGVANGHYPTIRSMKTEELREAIDAATCV